MQQHSLLNMTTQCRCPHCVQGSMHSETEVGHRFVFNRDSLSSSAHAFKSMASTCLLPTPIFNLQVQQSYTYFNFGSEGNTGYKLKWNLGVKVEHSSMCKGSTVLRLHSRPQASNRTELFMKSWTTDSFFVHRQTMHLSYTAPDQPSQVKCVQSQPDIHSD